MRLHLLASLILGLSVLPFTSCQTQGRAEADKSKVHVGVVFDIGGKDDRSFNAAAWEGAKHAAEELPIVLRDVEPGDPTSIEPAMRAFAERGYDLIIGVGFAQTPIMQQVAKDYPNLSFAIIDGAVPPEEQLPNVAYLLFKEHQGSYLVGMIAARKSQTGTLGFIGGMDIPLIHKFATGYEEGARAVNPNVRVITNFVGVTDAAWNNPGKGKELALAQIGKGADIIFTAAGNSGLGAFDAVEQNNKFVIGVDSNQNWVKPGHVLTSMVKRVDTAVYQTVKDKVNNAFKGGVHVYGLENDGISYALDKFNEALIPSEVLREVDAAKQKIIGGEIQVTDAMAK
jgi:basic membrane protein A